MFEVLNFPLQPIAPLVNELALVYSGESERGGHQLETAEACPRQWALKYPYGVERVECPSDDGKVPAWLLGTLVHQWLANEFAQWLPNGEQPPVDGDRATEMRANELGEPEAARDAAVLAHEFAKFTTTMRPAWRILAVEHSIRCDFGDAGVYTSGADAIFWDIVAEAPVIVDWKTAGRITTGHSYPYSTQYLRYRMILRQLARQLGKPDDWGAVFVGLIPTGKTNFDKRELIECAYFPEVVDHIETQTRAGLEFLHVLETSPDAAMAAPRFGQHCHGPYSGCQYRREFCFVDGRCK